MQRKNDTRQAQVQPATRGGMPTDLEIAKILKEEGVSYGTVHAVARLICDQEDAQHRHY